MDIVVTTIFPPTKGMYELADGLSRADDGTLWVVGDVKGPFEYPLDRVKFFPIGEQRKLPFSLVELLPEKHYTRKNLGYLLAIQAGAPVIVETDDDNIPLTDFWKTRGAQASCDTVRHSGWVNVYRYFSPEFIWPRGFPLENLQDEIPGISSSRETRAAYIHQGLADQNPDVDAVYRLTRPLPISFVRDRDPLFLEQGAWCPFNSQNTTFFPPAYPLLYLPSHCSFRMTDIWRSFVAQKCLWAMGSGVLFHCSTVYQERNEHSLLRDFSDEISGYLKNAEICRILSAVTLDPGLDTAVVCANLKRCYSALIEGGIFPEIEMELLDRWCTDLSGL
jgi:hypothetical protein